MFSRRSRDTRAPHMPISIEGPKHLPRSLVWPISLFITATSPRTSTAIGLIFDQRSVYNRCLNGRQVGCSQLDRLRHSLIRGNRRERPEVDFGGAMRESEGI